MSSDSKGTGHSSRRKFLDLTAGAVAAGVGATALDSALRSSAQAQTQPAPNVQAGRAKRSKPNILFVFTDQERYRRRWPSGLSLPGHERLQRTGVTLHNHYCPAVMCTSSRAVLLTGLQTADNGMFENADVPWVKNLSTRIPTIGHMLRKAGYYTAYKGKWHLNDKFDSEDPDRLFTKEMEKYGFADYFSPGQPWHCSPASGSCECLTCSPACRLPRRPQRLAWGVCSPDSPFGTRRYRLSCVLRALRRS